MAFNNPFPWSVERRPVRDFQLSTMPRYWERPEIELEITLEHAAILDAEGVDIPGFDMMPVLLAEEVVKRTNESEWEGAHASALRLAGKVLEYRETTRKEQQAWVDDLTAQMRARRT